jgi:hypothetical protein
MSYDLAFWAGDAPADDDEATQEYERRSGVLENLLSEDGAADFEPPVPAMRAFLTELLERFPPLDESSDDDNVWATGPEPGDISGDFAYLTMTYPGSERAYETVTAMARRHGLVCYDPQEGGLV